MIRLLILVGLLLFSPLKTEAQVCPGLWSPIGLSSFETATVGATATKLPAIPSWAQLAVVTVEADAIRYIDEASATPTGILGHNVAAGSGFVVCGNAIGRITLIRVTTDATIMVSYYGG